MATLAEVLTHALKLPENERARMAHELLLSLEPEVFDANEIASAWQEEINVRLQKIADGDFKAHDWRQSIQEIRHELKKGD